MKGDAQERRDPPPALTPPPLKPASMKGDAQERRDLPSCLPSAGRVGGLNEGRRSRASRWVIQVAAVVPLAAPQ
jgi:hypothetical protein